MNLIQSYHLKQQTKLALTSIIIFNFAMLGGIPPMVFVYISFIFTNMTNTIVPKLQDNHRPNNRMDQKFYHPFMQTEMMAIGQMLCLFVYCILKNDGKKHSGESSDKPKASIWFCFVYVAVDVTTNVLQLMAINYLSGSAYNIISGIVLVSTAIFSKFMLNKQYTKSQIFGCALVMVGIAVTAMGEQFDNDTEQKQYNFLLGVILTLTAYTLEGFQMVFVEQVFEKYSMPSTQFLGISGITGTIVCTLSLVLFSFVGCPWSQSQCVQSYEGTYHLEHLPSFFRDLSGDSFLTILTITYIIVTGRYYYDVNEIIIHGSAMIYQLVTAFSNGFVWIVGIMITLIGNGREQYLIESLNYKVILMKLAGFILVTLGAFLYDKIIHPDKQEEHKQLVEEDFSK